MFCSYYVGIVGMGASPIPRFDQYADLLAPTQDGSISTISS